MKFFVRLDAYGVIAGSGHTDDEAFAHMQAHESGLLEVPESFDSHQGKFFDPDAGTVRPLPPCLPRVEATTLYDLPIPCTVTIDGVAYPETHDGVVECAFDFPGTYRVTIASPVAQPGSVDLVVP